MKIETIRNFLDEYMLRQEIKEITMPGWMLEIYRENTTQTTLGVDRYASVHIKPGKEFRVR